MLDEASRIEISSRNFLRQIAPTVSIARLEYFFAHEFARFFAVHEGDIPRVFSVEELGRHRLLDLRREYVTEHVTVVIDRNRHDVNLRRVTR